MNTQLNIAICEDLIEEQKNILAILEKHPLVGTTTVYSCGEDFLKEYTPKKFDLIFMDIYMKEVTGVEVVSAIREANDPVCVAFTTTSLDHTLESYRLDALKYMEKPVKSGAVNELLQIAKFQKENVPKLKAMVNGAEECIPLAEIVSLEQKGANFFISTIGGDCLTAKGKITNLPELQEHDTFHHCHKSFIVNFSFVKSINKELLVFEMTNGSNTHISRDGFWKTKRAFENYLFGKSREDQHE